MYYSHFLLSTSLRAQSGLSHNYNMCGMVLCNSILSITDPSFSLYSVFQEWDIDIMTASERRGILTFRRKPGWRAGPSAVRGM